jgi:nucleotide-binding universal stress UspA family protein
MEGTGSGNDGNVNREGENPAVVVDRSDEFDAIVMGQREETPWSVLLGGEPERVAAGAVAPVLIVRERGDGTA